MARTQIADLPQLQDLTEEQLKELFGAGLRSYRPTVEALENRLVMSASYGGGQVLSQLKPATVFSGPVLAAVPQLSASQPVASGLINISYAAPTIQAVDHVFGGLATGTGKDGPAHLDALKAPVSSSQGGGTIKAKNSLSAAEEARVRDLANLMGMPADNVVKTGMTAAQVAEFAASHQKLIVGSGDTHDPNSGGQGLDSKELWNAVAANGANTVLKGAFVKQSGISDKAASGLSLKDVLEGAAAIARAGAAFDNAAAWKSFKDYKAGKISEKQFVHQVAGVDADAQRTGTDGVSGAGSSSKNSPGQNPASPGRPDAVPHDHANTSKDYGDSPPDTPAPGSTQGGAEFTVTDISRSDDGTADVFWSRSGGKDGKDGDYVTHYNSDGTYDVFSIGKDGDGQRVGGGRGTAPADSVIGKTTNTTAPAGDDPRTGGSSGEALFNTGDSTTGNTTNPGKNPGAPSGDSSSTPGGGAASTTPAPSDTDNKGDHKDETSDDDSTSDDKPSKDKPEDGSADNMPNPMADDRGGSPIGPGRGQNRQLQRDLDLKRSGGFTDGAPEGDAGSAGRDVTINPAAAHQQQHQTDMAIAKGSGGNTDAPSHTADAPDLSGAQIAAIDIHKSGGVKDPAPTADGGPVTSGPAPDGSVPKVIGGQGPKVGKSDAATSHANVPGQAPGAGRIAK